LLPDIELGDVVKTRNISAVFDDLKVTYSAPRKAKKHTQNLLFLFLGTEEISVPLTQNEIEQRLNALGWKKMSQDEFDKHHSK